MLKCAVLAACAMVAACLPAAAQVDVQLQLPRRQFVGGESVKAVVTITNHAGRDLVFQGDGRVSWLDFVIKDERGAPVTTPGSAQFRAVQIRAGQSMAREVDLSTMFRVTKLGTYSVYAVVRLPGERTNAFLSNRLQFNVTNARTFWSQKIGVAGRPGEIREFRVLTYSGDQKTSLYIQVLDTRTGHALHTYSLGEALLFRKPEAAVDGKQQLHLLFLSTPSIWSHFIIDINGKVVARNLHKRGLDADPRLVTLGTGEVLVAGSAPYDPVAERQAQGRIHKISERPAILYQ